jgi:hypothetical protein
MTVGQIIGSALIAAGMSIGYPAFAVLYAASSSIRVAAWRMARPTDTPVSIARDVSTTTQVYVAPAPLPAPTFRRT